MAMGTDQGEGVSAPGGGARPGLSMGPALPTLAISGLVVTRADLVAVLRLYVSNLADVEAIDSDRFLLSLAPPAPGEKERSP